MLPYIYEVEWKEGLPSSWEAFWDKAGPYSFVLESGRSGRYTYVGIMPSSILFGHGDRAEEKRRVPSLEIGRNMGSFDNTETLPAELYETSRTMQGRPMDIVRQWMSMHRSPIEEGQSYFVGGCVGYWGYDVVRSLENLPNAAEQDLNIPDYAFMMVDQCWVYDRDRQKLMICVHQSISREMTNRSIDESKLLELYHEAEDRSRQMLSWWQACARQGEQIGLKRRAAYEQASEADQLFIDLEQDAGIDAVMTKAQFTQAVERIQEYIRSGDVFQVNLSIRQDREINVKAEALYEWLRLINPSPYMGLIRMGAFQFVSASPELLIKQQGRTISTRPIAGTRRRGNTAEEDLRLEEELRSNEKERAEHIMLVDLERNDIGRAAKYGSVKVDQFMVVERYSHVMHLVSEVSGTLQDGLDAFDALAAVFPGGTITGAPKIRTMEIIEELEPVRRGIYTGSFGWIDYNGNMEFNIIIRTLLLSGGRAYVQAGAGIVIDSIPEREYKESLNKAKALWKAVQYAERMEEGVEGANPKKGGIL